MSEFGLDGSGSRLSISTFRRVTSGCGWLGSLVEDHGWTGNEGPFGAGPWSAIRSPCGSLSTSYGERLPVVVGWGRSSRITGGTGNASHCYSGPARDPSLILEIAHSLDYPVLGLSLLGRMGPFRCWKKKLTAFRFSTLILVSLCMQFHSAEIAGWLADVLAQMVDMGMEDMARGGVGLRRAYQPPTRRLEPPMFSWRLKLTSISRTIR